MACCCSWDQAFWSVQKISQAPSRVSAISSAFMLAKLKPVPSPVNLLYGWTESRRPPVSRTTGRVP